MATTLQATGNPILCKDCFKGRKEKLKDFIYDFLNYKQTDQ